MKDATRTCLVGLSFLAAVSGCTAGIGDETEVIGEAEDSLNGSKTYNSCTDAQEDFLDDVFALAVSRVITYPWPMLDCLTDSVFSRTAPSPEYVVQRLAEDMPTTVTCVSQACNNPNANACAPVNVNFESVTFSDSFINNNTVARVTGVLLHEIAHNKGWSHGPSGQYEYPLTVTEQVEACGEDFDPNNNDRSEAPYVSELAPTGGLGGSFFDLTCPNGDFMSGLYGISNNVMKMLWPKCTPWGGGTTYFFASAGSSSGATTYRNEWCGAGHYVTGISGRQGALLDKMRIYCTPEEWIHLQSPQAAVSAPDIGGGNGGIPFDRHCPAGMVLKGLYGRSGAAIDRIRLVCADPTAGEQGDFLHESVVGNTSGAYHEEHRCWGQGSLRGLYGSVGARVDRYGGICRTHDTGWETPMPLHGGSGGTEFRDNCNTDRRLISMQFRVSDGYIRAARGRCGDIDDWQPGGSWSWNNDSNWLAWRGGAGGTTHTRTCDRGQYIAGMKIWKKQHSGLTLVDGVQPICRDIEENICANSCGGVSSAGGCYCDAACVNYGDCCQDSSGTQGSSADYVCQAQGCSNLNICP